MLKFILSMLCTSILHLFLLGYYLGSSPIIGNLMIIRVTSVECTWLGYLILRGPITLIKKVICETHVVY